MIPQQQFPNAFAGQFGGMPRPVVGGGPFGRVPAAPIAAPAAPSTAVPYANAVGPTGTPPPAVQPQPQPAPLPFAGGGPAPYQPSPIAPQPATPVPFAGGAPSPYQPTPIAQPAAPGAPGAPGAPVPFAGGGPASPGVATAAPAVPYANAVGPNGAPNGAQQPNALSGMFRNAGMF
jgi:hypothetical protein